ncbi:hypothetical protein ZWY2020_025459 [Hordeum vulgare]|nr:hypothetical protein ZWY2020_025459 [Hordeum vulgare]
MPSLGLALVLLVSLVSPTSSCTEQEKSSLHQLLAGLSRDGGLTASWRHDTDCCAWEGITCNQDMKVTDVSLTSLGLEGAISPFLGNLTGLLRLNLSRNLLTGGLPPELVSSSSILVLDVSFNRLTGGLSELPSSTPARPLQVLNISSNLFTGSLPSTTWEAMKSLVVLNASSNRFTGQIPTTPCVSAPSLAVIELSFNQLSGNIPPGLSNCSALKLLSAGYNNLSGTLPDALFKVTSLEHLSLPNNCGMIPEEIGQLQGLFSLNLSSNRLSGQIPEQICNLTNLQMLDLSDNHLTDMVAGGHAIVVAGRAIAVAAAGCWLVDRRLECTPTGQSLKMARRDAPCAGRRETHLRVSRGGAATGRAPVVAEAAGRLAWSGNAAPAAIDARTPDKHPPEGAKTRCPRARWRHLQRGDR